MDKLWQRTVISYWPFFVSRQVESHLLLVITGWDWWKEHLQMASSIICLPCVMIFLFNFCLYFVNLLFYIINLRFSAKRRLLFSPFHRWSNWGSVCLLSRDALPVSNRQVLDPEFITWLGEGNFGRGESISLQFPISNHLSLFSVIVLLGLPLKKVSRKQSLPLSSRGN